MKIGIDQDTSTYLDRGVWKGRADETISVLAEQGKSEFIQRCADRLERLVRHPGPWSAPLNLQQLPCRFNPQVGYRQQQGQQQQERDV